MSGARKIMALYLFILALRLEADSFRTAVTGAVEIVHDQTVERTASLGINGAVLIALGEETRFLKGIEIEITSPQAWLYYRGALVMEIYNSLNHQGALGVADLEGSRIAFEPLPGKIQNVYQIPLRPSHGLRTTPYVTVPTGIIPVSSFPILFRLFPVAKGINDELESMVFNLTVRPILSDEGAVTLIPRYPAQLQNRPFTLLIDDVLIEDISEPQILKEGEHHLVILSEDFRNISRHFVVERAKTINLTVELNDPTPIVVFEGPENASIYLDNVPVSRNREPVAVEPGQHEAKFVIGDYTIIKSMNIQRGKTYRVALAVDLTIHESE